MCNPSDKIYRINELPTIDTFPYLYKNFIIENNLPVLWLTFNVLSPPAIPYTIDSSKLFLIYNSNGCPITSYELITVIDNVTNKTLAADDYWIKISLNNRTGDLKILNFNQAIDYSIFLSASLDGINWLARDL